MVAAIHAGLEAGMTWVDTAEVYGDGVSERIVGRALAGRDDVLVFTKVAPDEGSGIRPDEIARSDRRLAAAARPRSRRPLPGALAR